MKFLDLLAYILVIVGAINWGLVGVFDWNLVSFLFGAAGVEKLVYGLVGASGIYKAFGFIKQYF